LKEDKEKPKAKNEPNENLNTKVRTEFKDQKIKDAFVFSNKTTILNKKTARDSKSKDTNIPIRSKRNRVERSESKESQEKESLEDEEEIPKIKTVKIEKKKSKNKVNIRQEEDEEGVEDDEIHQVEVTKNKKVSSSKSKGKLTQKRSKSVPTKSKKKNESNRDEDESEEENDESSFEEEDDKKKKRNKTSSRATKKTKVNTKYKKGKENPNIEILSTCKYSQSKEQILFTECCVNCNNRNLIRAVNSGNIQLLRKSLEAKKLISDLNEQWSKEYPVTPIELAILRGDKLMISEIITNEIKSNNSYTRVTKPFHKITEADTGELSIFAYGVMTRKLNMTRGNRMGNNAFLDDVNNNKNFDKIIIDTILEKCKDPKLIDYITAAFTDPLNKERHSSNFNIDFVANLYQAVAAGNRVIAQFLLEKMIKNNINGNYGYNQLHCSVLQYKDEKFDVSHKSSLNKKTIGSANILTPVSVACINPNEKVLKRLVELGGDWHFSDFHGVKPIHYASACEGIGPLKYLLSIGANVNEPTKDKRIPLIIASRHGRSENVKFLLKNNANALQKSKTGNTALHEAAEHGHLEVLKTLLEHQGVVVDMPGKDKMTPLMIAAAHGHKDCVIALLDSGAKVLKKDKFKRTALLMACKSGQTVIASILLRYGSDFNQGDSSSNSPLHYACAYGWIEIVQLLLKAGANVNSTNMWKISPLEIAMLKNHFGIVKFLLNNSQVDVNMKFDKSNTLLHHSFTKITEKSQQEIEYLLGEKKADPNSQNIEGKACIHLLAEYTLDEYKLANMSYNSNRFNIQNGKEISPEEEAKLELNHKNIVRHLFGILKSNGAEINSKTVQQKCPLQIAIEKKNHIMIELLVESDPDIIFVDSSNQTILHLLSELLFDEKGVESLKKMIQVIVKHQGIGNINNTVDDNGFTPILKLFYIYSKNVKGFFEKIRAKEILDYKTKIYKDSLNSEAQNSSNVENKDRMEEIHDEDDEYGEEFVNKNDSSFPRSIKLQNFPNQNWSSLGKVAIKYGIDNSNKLSEVEKINRIVLTEEDERIVLEKTREKFLDYVYSIFNNLVFSYISIGCNVHSQIQKIKKYRDGYKKEDDKAEIEEENVNPVASRPHNSFNYNYRQNSFGSGFNNATNGYGGFGAVKVIKTSRRSNPRITRRNGLKIVDENNKKKIKDDGSNHFYDGVGLSNVLMLLMAFPINELLKHFIEDLNLEINTSDFYGANPLFYLIKNYGTINTISPNAFSNSVDKLLHYNVNINQYDNKGNSTFFLMSKSWNLEEMIKLYNYGANINKMNKQGENALIYYLRKKDKYKVELLLKNFNIDIDYRDDKMRTALHYLYNDEKSSADIDVSLKQIILSRKPDVNAKDIMKRTPLHYLFVKIGKEFDSSNIDPIVALSTLLEVKGIEIDSKDIFGNTPLHYASQRGATICAMSLIKHTDINTKNYEGNTPFGFSLIFKQPNFSIVLFQQSAYIYDNVYPLQNRSEKEIIKKQKKADNFSKSKLISQNLDMDTSSLGVSFNDVLTTNLNIDENELDKIEAEEESDMSDFDEGDDEEEDQFNHINNNYLSRPSKSRPALKASVKYNSFNFNNNEMEQSSKDNDFDVLNKFYFKNDEEKAKGISLFRVCVKNEYQGLTYLFVNQGFDLMKAIQDAFYENKFNLAMLLLDKSPYDEIYRSTNEKGQNLFHVLALYGKNVDNKIELNLFFDKLSEKGVRLDLPDAEGYTPIHYACENHFEPLFEYIINKHNPNQVLNSYTKNGYTPFICSIKGKFNISKSFKHFEIVLNQMEKNQISLLYYEDYYGISYKCTPLIHATRSYLEKNYNIDPILTEEGKKIIKLIQYGANVMERDINGIDCMMHCVKENNMRLLELFVKNCSNNIAYNAVDSKGRSLVHYAVCPFEEGSFENENLLSYLIENGFETNISDIYGKTPYYYASQQETGTNLRVFKRYNKVPQEIKVFRRQNSIVLKSDWPQHIVNYEKDADEFYQRMSSIISSKQEIKILPDPNGKFPNDTHEVIKDDNHGYWDIIMTKVKIGAGLYGEYNFYKMQLIHDKGRDVFILWNRFGRIGEVGQYQRTPFTTLLDAQTEFKKIFKSKSGNEWEHKSSKIINN